MITIVIHAYEICTENVIKLIVYLEPSRGIDRHAYRDTVAAAYKYRYRYKYQGPAWVDDIDLVWIRWPRKGHHNRPRSLSRTVIVPSGIDSIWHRSLSRTVMIPSGINR